MDGLGVQFDVFAKTDVKGPAAHPVFKFLTSQTSECCGRGIKWNFTKFLCDRDGKPVKRLSPLKPPKTIETTIAKSLA